MTDATEALLVRIDHFHDRKLYVTTVKSWLEELGVTHGRLVTMGDVHLLFIEASSAQNDALLLHFATKTVDTNAKDEPCIDRFIDIVGRKPITAATCKGFLEMNVLNNTLLERLMVSEWNCDKAWLDDALSTPRTTALIKWKEEAKNARKGRRKQAAQTRTAEREAKKAREEAEKAKKEAEEVEAKNAEDANSDQDGVGEDGEDAVAMEAEQQSEEAVEEKPQPEVRPASVQQKAPPTHNANKRKSPSNGHENHSQQPHGSIAKKPFKQQHKQSGSHQQQQLHNKKHKNK